MSINNKLISKESLRDIIISKPEKKFVFTNGCFDILHIGHLTYLEEAKALGDYLIVGLNSDESVRKLKGKNRPLVNENERALMLSSLYFVDYIVIFSEDNPIKVLDYLKPQIHCKGGDYTMDKIIEKETVERNSGKVVLLSVIENRSTSSFIDKIIEAYSK